MLFNRAALVMDWIPGQTNGTLPTTRGGCALPALGTDPWSKPTADFHRLGTPLQPPDNASKASFLLLRESQTQIQIFWLLDELTHQELQEARPLFVFG